MRVFEARFRQWKHGARASGASPKEQARGRQLARRAGGRAGRQAGRQAASQLAGKQAARARASKAAVQRRQQSGASARAHAHTHILQGPMRITTTMLDQRGEPFLCILAGTRLTRIIIIIISIIPSTAATTTSFAIIISSAAASLRAQEGSGVSERELELEERRKRGRRRRRKRKKEGPKKATTAAGPFCSRLSLACRFVGRLGASFFASTFSHKSQLDHPIEREAKNLPLEREANQ